MKLEVYERLVLLNVVPQEGDFTTLKLVRKLREALSFSEKEIAEIEFKNCWQCPTCQKTEVSVPVIKCQDCNIQMRPLEVTWDEEKAMKVVKDVHMGDRMLALCAASLKKLSDDKKLTEDHFSLYEKFIEVEEE